jgi:hypothetical protein
MALRKLQDSGNGSRLKMDSVPWNLSYCRSISPGEGPSDDEDDRSGSSEGSSVTVIETSTTTTITTRNGPTVRTPVTPVVTPTPRGDHHKKIKAPVDCHVRGRVHFADGLIEVFEENCQQNLTTEFDNRKGQQTPK